MSITREAELALLIASQESDDTAQIYQRTVSLDRAFDDSDPTSGTLLDVIGRDLWGDETGVITSEVGEDRTPSFNDLFYWKYLRFKHKWTYKRIAERVGVSERRVRYFVAKPYHFDGTCFAALSSRFDVLAHAYQGGAHMRDIAEDIFEDCGYVSAGACYVALHMLFHERKLEIRLKSWKHGMRSRTASRAQTAEYYRPLYRRRQDAKGIRRCEVRTKSGKRCSRWGLDGKCGVHSGTHPNLKWTRAAVCAALASWRERTGHFPRPREWTKAHPTHPNFKTVYNLFGSWGEALDAVAENVA